jgi:hypothetical protein
MIQEGDQVTIVHRNVVLICRVISRRPANNRMPEGAEETATIVNPRPIAHAGGPGITLETIREVSRGDQAQASSKNR